MESVLWLSLNIYLELFYIATLEIVYKGVKIKFSTLALKGQFDMKHV